ncbi:hypothetical protein PISMIDRAFT_301241 [Pisolithus microcarpus 441]|uniref:Zn(2)-C6 fungal-type domain-containing protein n=1 Tax=Pisolithus microcarpus 441 TaxID=765257 RepID=A0A0D0AES2_9AGAM|nr:hypothetical protein PISMIDRAFT_301241 [Pisolithus microcarpus 441]
MHQPRHRAQNPDRHHSFSSPIQIRHKGRNACSSCKKSHVKCVYDEGRRSCRHCSSRGSPCSRPSGILRPAVEASTSQTIRPTESTPAHRTQPAATADVEHASQDIPAGLPYDITRRGNVQQPLYQYPFNVGYNPSCEWYPPIYPIPEASEVVNHEDVSCGTVPHDETSPGSLATAIPWDVNPGDDYHYPLQTEYAQHSTGLPASQTEFPGSSATHFYSAPPLNSLPQDGTSPYSADSDEEDHAYSMRFPTM